MYVKDIRPYWLLVTKGYGLTVDDIDNSCPVDLDPYAKSYDLELQQQDAMFYGVCGNYIVSAVHVAVEHCLYGVKARSEYIKEPVFSKAVSKQIEEERDLTEEEKLAYQKQLLSQLMIMQNNFETTKIEREMGNEECERSASDLAD